jgi:hypothetical protein
MREEHKRSEEFNYRTLRIFGTNRKEQENGGYCTMSKCIICSLHQLSNEDGRHVALMGALKNTTFWSEYLKLRDHLRRLGCCKFKYIEIWPTGALL